MKQRPARVLGIVFLAVIGAIVLAFYTSSGFHYWCAYPLAVLESSRLESLAVKSRADVERRLFWVTTSEFVSLSNLFAASFIRWDNEANGYVADSVTGRVIYLPRNGDQYVSYRVLGRMPLDFIYDKQGRIVYWVPSFDY